MTLVVDASLVVAALTDDGPGGRWADQRLDMGPLFAPHLLPAEVANSLRGLERSRLISSDVAAIAGGQTAQLRVELVSYDGLADRVWALRQNLTAYDAWYVALAESLGCPLATLDGRLARAPGTTCEFMLPP